MDPYKTLGLPRDCTREEVKDAFRARSWQAHPDRGGDEAAFIRLCEAYKAVLAELDRFPSRAAAQPARARRRRRTSAPRPPDPSWKPELVLLDKPPPSNRPARPPDPSWEPELVLLDEPPRLARPPQPPEQGIARHQYLSWLQKLSARKAHAQSRARPNPARATGLITLLGVIVASVVMCWIAWRLVDH